MIASIFNKSRPINRFFLIAILLIGFIFSLFKFENDVVDFSFYINKSITFLALVLSLFIVDFIIKKNTLTHQNSYSILIWTCFILLFHSLFLETKVIFANFFILLALRRIISIKSLLDVKKKIFDAALWIFIASLFYFWAILFLVFLFLIILIYAWQDYRNWLIPIASFFFVYVLTQTVSLIVKDQIYTPNIPTIELTDFGDVKQYLISVFPIGLSLWALFKYIIMMFKEKRIVIKRSYYVMVLCFIITLAIFIISLFNNHIETYIFMLLPISIFFTILLESFQNKMIENIVLYAFLITIIMNFIIV